MTSLLSKVFAFVLLALSAGMAAEAQTYCTPAYLNGCVLDNRITHFSLGSISNTSDTACSLTPRGYADYTSISTNLTRSGYYTAQVSIGPGGGSGIAIWVDYNDDGVFDVWEKLAGTLDTVAAGSTTNVSFNVLYNAPLGSHRLRVRTVKSKKGSLIDPCNFENFGETEDYTVNIQAVPCSGVPSAEISASASSVCRGVPITLSTPPNNFGGITHQFQASIDGGITWTNLGADDTGTVYVVDSQNVSTQYRVVTSCSSGGSAPSAPVAIEQRDFMICHCKPGTTQSLELYMTNVTINGMSHSSSHSYTSLGFSNYTTVAPPADITTGIPAPVAVSKTSYANASVGVWVDYNQDEAFTADEFTLISPVTSLTTITGTVTAPSDALPGVTKMRVRLQMDATITAADACNNLPAGSSYGETEDYKVNINVVPVCGGVPDAVISASVGNICADSTFLLTASPSAASGYSYQFQVSTDGGSVWNHLGSLSPYYMHSVTSQTVTSQYRVIMKCASGVADTSAPVLVTQNTYLQCSCPGGEGLPTGTRIDCVVFAGIDYTSTDTYLPANYNDFTDSVAAAAVTKEVSYPITITTGAAGTLTISKNVGVWIDYDHSGTFSADEYTYIGNIPYPETTILGHIDIPATALTGDTRLRVRVQRSDIPLTPDGCISSIAGETEDYLVHISSGPPCSGAPPVTLTAPDSTVCPLTPFHLSISPAGFSGFSYQYLASSDSGATWSLLGSATPATSYLISSQTVPTQYRVIATCGTGTPDSSAMLSINQKPIAGCYCIPQYEHGCELGYAIYSINIPNALPGGGAFYNGIGCPSLALGYSDFSDIGPYLVPGATYPLHLSSSSVSNQYYSIWIDFNDNGLFEPSEKISTAGPLYGGTGVFYTFTVPAGAPLGNHRMRIRLVHMGWEGVTEIYPCNYYEFGETEDYSVQLVLPCDLVTFELGADTTINPGIPITLNAGNAGATYLWSTGETTQSISVNSAGVYYVTAIKSGCTATDTIVVTLTPPPGPELIVVSGTPPALYFSLTESSPLAYYTWYFGDGSSGYGPSFAHTYTEDGTYEVMVIITYLSGYADTVVTTVTITGVGVGEYPSWQRVVQVYPNPSSGLTVVSAEGQTILRLEVTDQWGRILTRTEPEVSRTMIDVSGLADGIYTLRIQTDKGISSRKLVVGGRK